MEILSFENSAKPASRKSSVFLGFVAIAVAGFSVLGTTLASSITVTGGTVTFGQGSVQATACDSAIVVKPAASFSNASGNGSFLLGSITLEDVDTSACAGKTFVIKAWGDTSTTPLTLYGSSTSITSVISNTTPFNTNAITDVTVTSAGSGKITYDFDNDSLAATSIYKITIEQQN